MVYQKGLVNYKRKGSGRVISEYRPGTLLYVELMWQSMAAKQQMQAILYHFDTIIRILCFFQKNIFT